MTEAGKSGNALRLSGSDDRRPGYVSIPDGILATVTDVTIAAWVYVRTNAPWQRVFDFGTGTSVNMYLTTNQQNVATLGTLRFSITTGESESAQRIPAAAASAVLAIATETWVHLAVVLGPSDGTLYVDGEPAANSPALSLRPRDLGATDRNWLGRSQHSSNEYFAGSIDEFRIYGRALSGQEIRSLVTQP